MKKKDLMKQLRDLAKKHNTEVRLVRQGKHEIWECNGLTFPIPRHNEIAEGTARTIISAVPDKLTEEDE